MISKAFKFAVLSGSVLLCLGLPAVAQNVVTVDFTGGYSTTFEDYGAGVYTATINGTSSASGIICDDFNDEVYANETWKANAYQASSLNSSNIDETMFGAKIGITGYAEVATLVSMMFGNVTTFGGITGINQSEIASAIWDITTTPNGISGLDSKAQALVAAIKNEFGSVSAAQAYLSGLKNLWILTPSTLGPGEPQEMWTAGLSVPEGGAALMYLSLAGITCMGAMFLRSKKQSSTTV